MSHERNEAPTATVGIDEDSMDEPDKDITSGDDVAVEEQNSDGRTEKNTEDDEEYEDRGIKEDTENESDSEESESEESDSLDEEEAEARRSRYVDDMTDLEKQFSDLKEQLYKERIQQIESQLAEVSQSEAKEYTGPLKQLEQECIVRTEVADQLKHYRTQNLENKLQCELQAAEQHFLNEENTLIETLTVEFEEKLRKIEEERHSAEMYSDLWSDDFFRSRKKRKGLEMFVPEKRKKPVTVTGPYIVYMLNEMDILEDWAIIRRAKSELARRKVAELSIYEKDSSVTACYKDGKFLYQGDCASVTSINTGEIWVSKGDGVKSKLYIAQFQKGKYTIKKAASVKDERR